MLPRGQQFNFEYNERAECIFGSGFAVLCNKSVLFELHCYSSMNRQTAAWLWRAWPGSWELQPDTLCKPNACTNREYSLPFFFITEFCCALCAGFIHQREENNRLSAWKFW